jgi:hypothetical protein
MKPVIDPSQVQGEGDYKATRRHRESVRTFVKSGKVAEAVHDAAPKTTQEEQALTDAERVGESHSKGEDPALKHSPPRKP